MNRYRVIVFSPSDDRENHYECASGDLDKVVFALTAMMEIGAWFRIERVS